MNIAFTPEIIVLLVGLLLFIIITILLSLKNRSLFLEKTEIVKLSQLESFKLQEQINSIQREAGFYQEEIRELKSQRDGYMDKSNMQAQEIATLKANLEAEQKSLKVLKTEFEEYGNKLELKLDAIMQKGLESKLKKFDDSSMKSLETLLKPYRESLDSFKKKVEESREDSIKRFATLSSEIETLNRAGMSISKEAQNLTEALKGKKQAQGGWGEMILESVLEYSGLIKGTHYRLQESFKDSDRESKRADVVIYLTNNRSIIVDSKVSLVAYEAYVSSESDEERVVYAKKLVNNFKNHIDNLASKDYGSYDVGTLQYIFMFVPIEGAFSLAVKEDPTLYEYALKKNIAVVNPSTLTVSLRTIYMFWQNQKANSRVTRLLDEAGKLYDKMEVFVSGFARLGAQLKTAQGTYEESERRLSMGHGNIMDRFENVKKLGARATKDLKKSEVEFDEGEFEIDSEERALIDEK